MALSENLAEFFDTDDFAITAVYNGANVNGIFKDEYFGDEGVESSTPVFVCDASDVAGIRNKAVIKIDGKNYEVITPKPDATGIIALKLNLR